MDQLTFSRYRKLALWSLRNWGIVGVLLMPLVSNTSYGGVEKPRPPDRFKLTIGRGEAICDAMLTRLNTTQFTRSPYCGLPEAQSGTGFQTLTKKLLTADQVVEIWPRVYWFTKAQNQNVIGAEPQPETARGFVGKTIFAWKYSPPVSVGNSGKPDNVLVWQGYGVEDDQHACGQIEEFPYRFENISPQLAFVLTDNDRQIDEAATRLLFGHPTYDAMKLPVASLPYPRGFSELGSQLGLIAYKNDIYIEAFYSSQSGDFYGNRKGEPDIDRTLGVFLRKDNKTTLACELVWLAPLPVTRTKKAGNGSRTDK
jgi:hypothetical protein